MYLCVVVVTCTGIIVSKSVPSQMKILLKKKKNDQFQFDELIKSL